MLIIKENYSYLTLTSGLDSSVLKNSVISSFVPTHVPEDTLPVSVSRIVIAATLKSPDSSDFIPIFIVKTYFAISKDNHDDYLSFSVENLYNFFLQEYNKSFIVLKKDRVELNFIGRGRAVKRGGNWNNGGNAGLFYVNLNNAPSNSNSNIGFRCCNSLKSQIFCFQGSKKQSNRTTSAQILAVFQLNIKNKASAASRMMLKYKFFAD